MKQQISWNWAACILLPYPSKPYGGWTLGQVCATPEGRHYLIENAASLSDKWGDYLDSAIDSILEHYQNE